MNSTPFNICFNDGNTVWTNMPLALTELFGLNHRRIKVDLSDVDKIRLSVRVSTVGSTNAVLFLQYSTDESAWSTLTSNLTLNGVASTRVSPWESIPAGAKGDVFIRVVGQGGDGVADPVLGNIYFTYR
jgi:hypothetical protein